MKKNRSIVVFLQTNERSGGPKIWIYKDRMTGEGNGRATVTYEDEETAQKAISEYHGNFFLLISNYVKLPFCFSIQINILVH